MSRWLRNGYYAQKRREALRGYEGTASDYQKKDMSWKEFHL